MARQPLEVLHGDQTMRVDMDYVSNRQNVDKGTSTISYSSSGTSKSERAGAFALDISGTVMDNKAYGGQGKTAEEVMQEAAATDVAQQKNYMSVMSNSMSDEDFAKLQEDGYNPNSTEVGTLVTVVDRIKAELAESGVHVSGYTDTLDMDTLKAITGDMAQAEAIASKLQENDVPVTEDNVTEVKQTLDKAKELSDITEGAMKYMVQNQMEPTIDNIYTAEFSSTSDGNRQGKGYYADEMPGYYSKKADVINLEQLMPQIEKVIKEADQEVNEDTVSDAKWLIEKGVPLTSESLSLLEDIKQTDISKNSEDIIDRIAQAMGEGKTAGEALLLNKKGIFDQAVELLQEVEQISDEAIEAVIQNEQPITIKNLLASQKQIQLDSDNKTSLTYSEESDEAESMTEDLVSKTTNNTSVTAKRQLEEIRLQMSVEANVKLLKSGISIDTTELEQLVEHYKELEQKQNAALFGESSDSTSVSEKASLFNETLIKVTDIASMPAAVIGRAVSQGAAFTLNYVYEQGTILQNKYQAAGETYEALMTAPRSDLGDSIKKAFRNVNELLDEIDMDQTDTNRRAARILGYNSMEITEENVEAIKEADETVTRVIQKMTPAATLQMIRDNVNPLETDLNAMEEYLSEMDADVLNEGEKYSKYLYKLEQNNEISQDEKEAYIGVYRLFRQIEKSDGAVIGSLVNQGAELSFKNLLSAVRSRKKSNIDISVDDDFGGLESVNQKGESISDQINTMQKVKYNENLVKDVLDNMEPSALADMNFNSEITLEEIAEQLKAYGDENSQKTERQYQSQLLDDIRKITDIEDSVIESLTDFDQPVTVDNLLAAAYMKQNRGATFKNLYERAEQEDADSTETDSANIETPFSLTNALKKAMTELTENFTSEEEINVSYENLQDVAKDILETAIEKDTVTSVDIKSMALTFKQVTLAANLAKEQNYEIPVMIGDEITSINLRIIHGEDNGKVTATTQSETYGKVAAEFTVTKDSVSGYIATDSKEGLQNLQQIEAAFMENLQSKDKQVTSLNMIYSKNLDIQKFGNEKSNSEQNEKVSSKELYSIAKEFLCSLQNSSSSR